MRTFAAIVWRDVILGIRASGGAALSAAFFALILVLVPFGLGPGPDTLKAAAPGLFWMAALLSTLLGLERVVQPDAEDGTLDLIRLSPLPLLRPPSPSWGPAWRVATCKKSMMEKSLPSV